MTEAEITRLLQIESVARKILDRWRAQEKRASAWMDLARRAKAGEDVGNESKMLDSTRVHDFSDLRVELGEVFGEDF
jgi:hypothetical protein